MEAAMVNSGKLKKPLVERVPGPRQRIDVSTHRKNAVEEAEKLQKTIEEETLPP